MSPDEFKFGILDYVLFSLSCAATIFIGIIIAIKDRWSSQSSESYLMADRQMSWFMVGTSTFASLISAVLFVGPTAEFYYIGMQFMWIIGSIMVASVYTFLVTVPKFFRLGIQITSAYEYLEYRFSRTIRMISSLIFTVGTLFHMAVILYAPCLILAQVTSLDIRLCVAIGAFVCMIYTGFGGLKAVIWVDNFQVLIMGIGAIALAVKGVSDAGGLEYIWERYTMGQRTTHSDLDPRPWKRHTVWNLLMLNGFASAAAWGSQQVTIQRYMAVKNIRHSQMSVIIGSLLFPLFIGVVFFIAMAAFALVGGNEPLLTGEITKPGQIFAYFLMKVMGNIPGLPGLVVAASFAAALSTMSSGQNSLAAVLLEDFIKPCYKFKTGSDIKEALAGKLSRITGITLGFVIMGLGIALINSDDMVFSLTRSLESFVAGPIFVLMLTGMFIPFVEQWGALCGCLSALVWGVQMYVGSLRYAHNIGFDRAPLYMNNFTKEIAQTEDNVTPNLYDTSYTWYVFMDVVVGVLVACVISAFVQFFKYKRMIKEDPSFKWNDLMPEKCYLYTRDDFLVAIGIRSIKKYHVEEKKRISTKIYPEKQMEEDGATIPLQIIALRENGTNVSVPITIIKD